ncbi:DUF1956 domain-containing protein [bacterium]|nr:DUF1956 domain-containing protein [bacterium]
MLDDTKRRLLNTAGQIFADKGFEAASIREICQQAEANIAAVHYHFGDKKQLYVATVRLAQCAQSDEIPFPELPADMPAAQRLRTFVGTMFERMLSADRPKWHLQLMLRELSYPTEACEAIVHDYIRPMADSLRTILAELLPGDMPEPERWQVGFSIVGQVLFYYVHQPIIRLLIGDEAYRNLTVDTLADHVTRFSLAALGQRMPQEVAS